MQLEFLELSPCLSIQNEQIMAGQISLLGCLRNRSKWPLKSFPRRDRCGGGRSEQLGCHHPVESGCGFSALECPWKQVGTVGNFVYPSSLLVFHKVGKYAVRTKSFENSRDTRCDGDRLTSLNVWIMTPLDSSLQVCSASLLLHRGEVCEVTLSSKTSYMASCAISLPIGCVYMWNIQ